MLCEVVCEACFDVVLASEVLVFVYLLGLLLKLFYR